MNRVAFWSYKGGTGRTLTLCNVAIELMRKGKNVGIVDFDLEAPGVHVLFNLDREEIKERGSFTDMLLKRVIGNLSKYVQEVPGLVSRPALRGKLYILPTINSPELDDIKFDHNTFDFINDICNNFIQIYMLDHLLIDTRTGFSVMGGLGATYSDAIFVCLRPDRQNVIGVKEIIKGYKIRGIEFYLVFSGVPEIDGAKTKILEVQSKLGSKGLVRIPLVLDLLLDEELYSVSKPDHEICKGYKQIADIIVSEK